MKTSAFVMLVFGLWSTSASAISERNDNWRRGPGIPSADETCETAMVAVSAPPPPMVPAERIQMVDREINSIIEAFSSGHVTGIDVVNSYADEMGGLQTSLRSPLMKGSMDGPGVDQSLANLEDEMTKLTKIMGQFQPEEMDAGRQGLKDRALRLLGRGKSQALSITASYQSNEVKIASILKGLGDGRTALEVDNGLLNREIERVREKMAHILDQIEIWKLREAKFGDFRNQLVAETQVANPDRRKKMQVDLVQNQLLLPIVQSLQMLEGQYDIFEAAVVAHRVQQEQNRLAIRTGLNLEKTAEEILPTLVTLAVTSARHARVMDVQHKAGQLLESGMTGINRQMDVNAKRLDVAMQRGPVDQAKIFEFRDEVGRIVGELQNSKGRYYVAIAGARAARDEKEKQRDDLISSIINSTTIDLLSPPVPNTARP